MAVVDHLTRDPKFKGSSAAAAVMKEDKEKKLWQSASEVVEQLTRDPKFKGSSTAAAVMKEEKICSSWPARW